MTLSLIATLIAPFALQAAAPVGAPVDATVATPAPQKPMSFAELPVEEATAPRCGIAFAIVQGFQEADNPRGAPWPDIANTGAREFFLQAMVRLIDTYELERADVTRMVALETERHRADDFVQAEQMLPACLALLEASATISATKGG